MHLIHRLPMLQWARGYGGAVLSADLLAAVIVTIMLIPQSLAYAMLANLPPEVGLYASILPLVAYAVFGTSRVLAVGPGAVVAASANAQFAAWLFAYAMGASFGIGYLATALTWAHNS